MGTLEAYTDPRYQSAVPFGSRSHWLQMWRSYLETVPAAHLLGGVGTNFNTQQENADVVAQHLARAGIRRARIEVPWNALDYASEQVSLATSQAARLRACARFGIRPLIVLNANSGYPCPALALTGHLAAPLHPGDRSVQLTTTSGIIPGYTGLSYQPPTSCMAGHLITSLAGTTCQLSQAMGGSTTLAAGSSVALHTLKYRPFGPPGGADYAQTSAGWQTYALAVARWAAGLLGRGGRSDVGFDLEVWNELTFGALFLSINNYYSPTPYGSTGGSWGSGSVDYQITLDTGALVGAHQGDFAGCALVNGFGNTTPWPSASDEPASFSGISAHPYAPVFTSGPGSPPAGETGITAINALSAPETTGYEPQYSVNFPEYALCGIQTEAHLRNVGPLVDGGKGRYTRGTSAPCWGWVTEIGQAPAQCGITDQQTALYLKAKQFLRLWLGWLGKGTQAILPYAVGLGSDTSEQQALETFLAYARAHSAYPADEGPYTAPCYAALRRAIAHLGQYADQAPPPGWGTGQGVGTRAITVSAVSDTHDHVQFRGDGTAAHPPLYDRDCLYLQPVQLNPRRFVLIYYVMTRDLMHVYDQTRTGGLQYDLPDAPFTITLCGIQARAAQISAYDPLADRSVPVEIGSAQDDALTLVLTASDRPYLLTIQERTSGAVAASSYLQNARLNWMLGTAYPAAPSAQYVGLFSVAPTNTTAGTELSAGNYQRVQIGLSGPAAPTVTPTGTTGSTTYAYQIIKKNAAGSTIGATGATGSTVTTITNGNATLTSSNYNALSWSADANAVSFDVLKWSGSAWTLLGNTSSTSMNDTGQSTQAYTVPTQNTTGWTTIQAGTTETVSNALPLVWPVANVNWGTAIACAIFDAPTAGNMLDFASLTSSQVISSGSQYSFPLNQLVLGEA